MIVNAAQKRFREKGFADTTLEEIAQEVGVVTSALYRHFPSKGHMLVELLARAQDQLEGSLAQAYAANLSPLDRLRSVIRAAIVQHRETGPLVSQLRQALGTLPPRVLDAVLRRQARIDREWVDMLCEARPDLARDRAAALVGAIGGVMASSEAQPFRGSDEHVRFYESVITAVVAADV